MPGYSPVIPATYLPRREFLAQAGRAAAGLGAAVAAGGPLALAAASDPFQSPHSPESLVKLLFESFTPRQKELVCFPWDHQDKDRGLLRTYVNPNWMITPQEINSDFYTKDQRAIVRGIVEGMISPEFQKSFYKQQRDDSGEFGNEAAIALFGEPGAGKFEFVLSGRHTTLRCDGNSAEHVAFGGPIFYGHAAQGFDEKPDHPGNVYWPQAVEANKLYEMLDGKQRELALVETAPFENDVKFEGQQGDFDGIPVAELSADQQARVQQVLAKLVEPYRQSDRDEVIACLKKQGGLQACRLAFYKEDDIGEDGVWDIWRLEGPSFVWHYRGAPHVHVWVNVADDASVKLNA
ncbi:MAG: hypothetical protein CMJ58_11010 [Planctomycetaceae bacterium]|nr:hypothetical protein [Planctomycetaceae bacterium]